VEPIKPFRQGVENRIKPLQRSPHNHAAVVVPVSILTGLFWAGTAITFARFAWPYSCSFSIARHALLALLVAVLGGGRARRHFYVWERALGFHFRPWPPARSRLFICD